jgi:hypothetical protein
MKLGFVVLFCCLTASVSLATVRYVSRSNPVPQAPYITWETAAASIQDAIDVSITGDEIVVTNGIYDTGGRAIFGTMTNRVSVDRPILVRSVNGHRVTVIQGFQLSIVPIGDGAVRCVYLTNGASLSGFTVMKGATRSVFESSGFRESSGAGVWCESTNVIISNCVITANYAYELGGGVYGATLFNCVLSSNKVLGGLNSFGAFGGAVFGGVLTDCILKDNYSAQDAGGAFRGFLTNCSLTGNSSQENGGAASESTLMRCTMSSNSAFFGGAVEACGVYNSLLFGNYGREGGAADFCNTINNSILVFNSAGSGRGGGASNSSLRNCIVQFNSATNSPNYDSSTLNYCCAVPLASGTGNFTNAPGFVGMQSNNFRLSSNSPCINAGANAYVVGTKDLDGRPRIVSGTVDIGAYEFQPTTDGQFIGWLQQYGLPTDGSADFSDADADGMSNWNEWRADTIPTNALSALRMLSATNNNSGINLTWQSVPSRSYFLERATNLDVPAFQVIASNIAGVAGAVTYIDSSATNSRSFFYRVGVP